MANETLTSNVMRVTEIATYELGLAAAEAEKVARFGWVKDTSGQPSLTARWFIGDSDDLVAVSPEGNDATTVVYGKDFVDITASQKAINRRLTNLALDQDTGSMDEIIQSDGASAGRSKDAAFCALFTGFTTNYVDRSDDLLRAQDIIDALVKLKSSLKQFADDDKLLVLNYIQMGHLMKDAIAAGYLPSNAVQMQVDGKFSQKMFGCSPVETSLVPTTDSGHNSIGAIIHRQAIGVNLKQAPKLTIDYVGRGLGYDITTSIVFGVGIARETFGVGIKTANTVLGSSGASENSSSSSSSS